MRTLFVSYDDLEAAARKHRVNVIDYTRSDILPNILAPWHAVVCAVDGGWMFWEDARDYQTWRNQI
jgi:hypothetical protein